MLKGIYTTILIKEAARRDKQLIRVVTGVRRAAKIANGSDNVVVLA